MVFLLFVSYYWVHETLQNVIHVSVAGVVGTWWFVTEEANSCCSKAVGDSFFRAITYSFGSICFGSLLVAIVKALRALEYYTRDNDDFQFLSCIIQCLLGCLESILEEINKWAYVYVGYVQSHFRLTRFFRPFFIVPFLTRMFPSLGCTASGSSRLGET